MPTVDTDTKRRRAASAPRVLIGARVRSSTDPIADSSQRVRGQFGQFDFDYVHDQNSGQEDVFYTTVRPLVHKLIEGKSSAILLYGAPKTGKTYTIEGVGAVGGHKEGLVPRAVALLHHLVQTSQHKGSLTVSQSALTTGVTPQLLDLQCPGAAPQKLPQNCDQCNPSHPHLHLHPIRHPNEIFQVLGSGKLVNSLGSPVSCSPSSHNWKGPALPVGPGTTHTILTIAFTRSCCNDMGAPEIAKLHFVELAAPPSKQARGGEGHKGGLAQAHALSKAYSSLTSVLLALKQQRRKQDQEAASVHIPWRECSLTKWLQEPLSGSSYVVLMGTVAAGSSNAGDTLATLNWLSRFRAEGSFHNEAVWISPDGDVEGSPHCHERRWPPGYMQWREHEHRRLHREGLLTHPQRPDFGDQAVAGDHCCETECQAPEEDEQRELKAARKALKKSLKELDSAEADRSHLQRQVSKLSQTLQVQVSALKREAARIRTHNEVHSAAKRQEHEKQVQLLQQQLKAAEEEHRSMQACLEASIQAAAAKEAAAAAAAKAEQAAVQAAAQAKQQQQSSAAAAAVAGAQPQLSCPGFQPLALPQQPPEQQVWQEFQGQRLLNTAGAAAAAQPSAAMQRFGWTDVGTACSASRTCISPTCGELPTYASRIHDMQDHINALNRSLADNRRSSPKRQHVHKSSKRISRKDKHGAQEHSKRQRSLSPQGPARGQTGVKTGVTDLFDSDAESDEELESSGGHSDASEASSDSDSLDGSRGRAAHKKLDLTTHKARADTAERNLAAAQDSLADTRQSLDTLQTHHLALKQHLEGAELHSQDSATQACEFAARVKELSADKEALVSELVTVNKSAAHSKQDFKCLVKCLKGSEPLQAITALLQESESDSGAKARSSELMWVMKRLCDHFKQNSGAQQQVAAFAADKQSLQEKLNQHLEAAQSSTAAMHAELSSLRDKAAMSEAAVTEAQKQAQQLSREVEQVTGEKAHAEQQVGELRAVQGQLELEVARLQHQLQGLEGQLQSEVGQLQEQLQAEVKRLQGQLQQARAEEEEAQEQRHAAKLHLSKFVKELDASTSEVSELESKLSAAQRRIQKQAEEQEEAESARAQQGQQLNALAQDMQALQSSLERMKQDRQQAYEEAGQAKARLGVCEHELSLARQEAEGRGRSGQALSAELHTLGRQNSALQQQLASVQAQLEETLDGRQAEERKRERAWKQAADEHATALLAVEARLAGKQREVAGLRDNNARLFSRFQDMREQLARSEDKVSHDKLRGWLDGMVEQFEEARQHNVLHSVLRSDDRWDSLQASARRTDSRSPLSGHRLHEDDAGLVAPVRTTSNVYAELTPLQSQKSEFANPYLSPARTVSYVPTTPLGKQVAASADAIRRRLLQTPASEARHAASQLESAKSVL
ncbi:hypothetical protein WJX77_003665 [Trebouxia sp. C0004]